MLRERKSEQPRGLLKKCKMQKREHGAAVPSAANSISNSLHDALFPVLLPTRATREGSFVVRTNRHGCARFLLARLGIGRRVVGIERREMRNDRGLLDEHKCEVRREIHSDSVER